jgi:arylsulfatase A-like enzyme
MKRPNILVVLTDQLRRNALACHGDPNASTPHLDALAREGVRFDAACSTYPVCVPYRFTFMTGLYPHSRMIPAILWRMSPAEHTLADDFNAADYETAYFGKWHLYGGLGPGLMKRPIPREHRGRWKRWFGFEFRNNFFDTTCFEDDDPTPRPLPGYQTDGLFDAANDFLARRDSTKPFALVLSVEAPHPPFEAPEAYEKKWLARDIVLPPNFMVLTEHDDKATAPWSQARPPEEREELIRKRKLYYAMLENLDDNMGRLMARLKETGQDRNTIVVFTSDHGEFGGSHALQEKQYAFEESTGVPLLVWGPGCGIPAGRTLAEPVCTEDLLPTFLGLAGLRPGSREPLYGSDLSPLITGKTDSLARNGVMLEFVSEIRPGVTFYQRGYRAFRSRRYKYVAFGGGPGGMTPWQFFDLQEDPGELHNRVADPACADLLKLHHGWLRDRMIETGDDASLAPAFGHDWLNQWADCSMKAHKGEKF